MSDPRLRTEADEYLELAEVLHLGEAIPAHLQRLWSLVADDPVALARLEHRRMWCGRLALALARARALEEERDAAASVVLELSLSPRIGAQVERRSGWTRALVGAGELPVQAVARAESRRAVISLPDLDLAVELGGPVPEIALEAHGRDHARVRAAIQTAPDVGYTLRLAPGGRVALPAEARAVRLRIQWAERAISADEVSSLLGISRHALDQLCSAGEIPARRSGKAWRFGRSSVRSWMSSRLVGVQIHKQPEDRKR